MKTPPQQRKDTNQWYFSTRALEELTDLRALFYRDKKKVVPRDIQNLISSPVSIAVWYMDDGNLDYRPKSHYNFRISTDSFSLEENMVLVDMLKNNFNIVASISNALCRGKRYPRLYIGVQGRDSFFAKVKPYVLYPCFARKIPILETRNDPSETEPALV